MTCLENFAVTGANDGALKLMKEAANRLVADHKFSHEAAQEFVKNNFGSLNRAGKQITIEGLMSFK